MKKDGFFKKFLCPFGFREYETQTAMSENSFFQRNRFELGRFGFHKCISIVETQTALKKWRFGWAGLGFANQNTLVKPKPP